MRQHLLQTWKTIIKVNKVGTKKSFHDFITIDTVNEIGNFDNIKSDNFLLLYLPQHFQKLFMRFLSMLKLNLF